LKKLPIVNGMSLTAWSITSYSIHHVLMLIPQTGSMFGGTPVELPSTSSFLTAKLNVHIHDCP
jgi:hypothetical protein